MGVRGEKENLSDTPFRKGRMGERGVSGGRGRKND